MGFETDLISGIQIVLNRRTSPTCVCLPGLMFTQRDRQELTWCFCQLRPGCRTYTSDHHNHAVWISPSGVTKGQPTFSAWMSRVDTTWSQSRCYSQLCTNRDLWVLPRACVSISATRPHLCFTAASCDLNSRGLGWVWRSQHRVVSTAI